MDDKTWALLMQDIQEIKGDMKEMKSEMITLKLKVATFSSFIGAAVGYIITHIKDIFHKL